MISVRGHIRLLVPWLSRKGGHSPYLPIVIVYLVLLLLSSVSRLKLRNVKVEEVKHDKGPDLGRSEQMETELVDMNAEDVGDVTDEEKVVLAKSFRAADFDGNKRLSLSEITMAINRETKRHIMGAMRNNFKVFFALDKEKKNGQVDWSEYYQHYLHDLLGLDPQTILDLKTSPTTVDREIKEAVSRLKAAWSEAAKSNPDAVNIDEFLSLEHPESSTGLLVQQVEEMLAKHDQDNDGKLSQAEFIKDPFQDLGPEGEKDRKNEFDQVLDKNHDGKADRKELVQYLDPKNQHWANNEAKDLVKQADSDLDQELSLLEMLRMPDLFLTSKLVSPDISFHGAEF